MLVFVLKKWFFDLWDNLFRIVLLNLGMLLGMVPAVLVLGVDSLSVAAKVAVVCLNLLWLCAYLAACSRLLQPVTDGRELEVSGLAAALRRSWLHGLVLALAWSGLAVLAGLTVQAFGASGEGSLVFGSDVIFLLLNGLLFWLVLGVILCLLFFLPAASRLGEKPARAICRSAMFVLDNPLFSLLLLCMVLAGLAASAFLAFLLPGPLGMLLFVEEAFRLRLLKYDYLQQNGVQRLGRHEWKRILSAEKETLGNRSLRNLLFPWKD